MGQQGYFCVAEGITSPPSPRLSTLVEHPRMAPTASAGPSRQGRRTKGRLPGDGPDDALLDAVDVCDPTRCTGRLLVGNRKRTLLSQPAFSPAIQRGTDRCDVGPLHASSLAWSHPAVPISGLVRSQGLDRPVATELVGYGDTGATSELP
jgi:hypothetical protein